MILFNLSDPASPPAIPQPTTPPTPIAWLPIRVVDSAARKLDTDRMDGVPGEFASNDDQGVTHTVMAMATSYNCGYFYGMRYILTDGVTC